MRVGAIDDQLDILRDINALIKSIPNINLNLIWSTGTNQKSATKKQINELRIIVDTVLEDMFKFIDLDNKDHRQQAIQMINDIRDMKVYTEEPICITYKKADELIHRASMKLRDLNLLLPKDSEQRDTSFYYNWLDEDK